MGGKKSSGEVGTPKENIVTPDAPLSVKWVEKYDSILSKYWDYLPRSVGSFIATVAVFILGATVKGEWIHIAVHFIKAFHGDNNNQSLITESSESENSTSTGLDALLESYNMQGLPGYWVNAALTSYLAYFGVGGFLHWYYYVNRRHLAHEWKCQPDKWLSPKLERHEIFYGSFSLLLGSTLSSIVSCYIMNGGKTTIYYDMFEHGLLWWVLSWPVLFVYQDYLTYWHHRWYHTPFMYKHFHKLHHTYKQPTAFSVTAIHPVEFIHLQLVLISPMALFPVHWAVFVINLMYLYYHGIIDHSGINFQSYWWQPWQPDSIFHDNHHQYFHVNFGFNCSLWDTIHGTYRQKNKVYREDIFYGKGKDLSECDVSEISADLEERKAENKLAYRGDDRDQQVKLLEDFKTK